MLTFACYSFYFSCCRPHAFTSRMLDDCNPPVANERFSETPSTWLVSDAGVSGADDGQDEPPDTEPRPPAPTWNAVPTTAAAAMAAGPLPPAPADPAPPAPLGPSPEDDESGPKPAATRARRVVVPAGDHLWGGRDGGVSVAAVGPRTAAVLERGQQEDGPPSFAPVDGPAEGEPPRRLHLVCRRGARLWGQVRARTPPASHP